MIIFCKIKLLIILILLNIIWLNMDTNFDLLHQFHENPTTMMAPHHQTSESQMEILGCGLTTQANTAGNPAFELQNHIN